MTDERIDALIRSLDVEFEADPDFERSTYSALLPRARTARVRDASRIGRLMRDLRLLTKAPWTSTARPLGRLGLIALLILATALVLAIIGALHQSIQNGPLIVSIHGELQAIDVLDGSVRPILPPDTNAKAMSRSPDGRLVTFWTIGGGHSHLFVVGVDGQHRRELASGLSLGWSDAIDVWSSDSRFLATEVILDRLARIVVVDVDTGAARVVTPTGLAASNPLWSPDDRWIAFDAVSGLVRSLAMIRTDGSDMRTLSQQGGSDNKGHVGGPDTWSPDGKWIYFDDSGAVYRVNVVGDSPQRLTGDGIGAYAPASSPDGTHIAFIVDHNQQYWDLYAANSDGTDAHKLLDHAEHDGWSADSRYILAQWNPTDPPGQFGGLAVIRPDGSEFRVVFPFDAPCPQTLPGQRCIDGVGWGQARP